MKRSTESKAFTLMVRSALAAMVLLGISMPSFAELPLCDLRQRQYTPECRDYLVLRQARSYGHLMAQAPAVTNTTRIQMHSCNLREMNGQCRQYSLLENARDTLVDLQEGCESMGGKLLPSACPDAGLAGSCLDIVRNYHKPDVIYNNFYYEGAPSQWTPDTMEEVCGNLGGELVLP